ncbi:MAG: triose-phosphate isomerase [Ignavibacteria bacterium]|nr:triose-phosphate isomerase [Ignavibacteria bacterium]
MRKKFVAGNWKMYKDKTETVQLISELIEKLNSYTPEVEIAICPPFTSIELAGELIKNSPIKLGAQNMHSEIEGAFTGEVSAKMLKSFNVEYVILGHSERRTYFKETDEFINQKIKRAIEFDLKPIFCLGETLEERENGKTFDVVENQLRLGLNGVSRLDVEKIVIAYEPVWAIGTGRTATPEQAQEVHSFLREKLSKLFDSEIASKIKILYGGSVKPENARDLFKQPDIDGGLIGGACLKADSFYQIILAAQF